jgi:lysozyme
MTVISKASDQGVVFLLDKEGVVTRAYRDSGGVITIGGGFTMGSKIFASYWLETRGHALRMGDTITVAETRKLIKLMANEEYGAAVARKIKPTVQHVFDGSMSAAFNFGIGGLDWQWGKALARGAIKVGADLLRTTAVTAGGRRLSGLVRRRAAEANLIETGYYGTLSGAPVSSQSTTVEDVRAYQTQLRDLGYYKGDIDGNPGKLTKGAVENFQRANGLKVDGIVGPATRATLIRALEAKLRTTSAGGGGLAIGTGSSAVPSETLQVSPLSIVLIATAAFIVISLGFWLWSNRGRFTGVRTPS